VTPGPLQTLILSEVRRALTAKQLAIHGLRRPGSR
jgi:hypothetical protein